MSGRGRGSGHGRGRGRGRGNYRDHTNHPVVSTLMELMPQVAATGNTSFTCMLAELINQAQIEFVPVIRPGSIPSRAPRREVLNKSVGNTDRTVGNTDRTVDNSDRNVDNKDKITQFKRILELVDDTLTKSMWTDTLASEYLSAYGVELNMYGYTLPALIRNTRGVNGVTSKTYPGRFFIAVKGEPRDEPVFDDNGGDDDDDDDDEQITFTFSSDATVDATVEMTDATVGTTVETTENTGTTDS